MRRIFLFLISLLLTAALAQTPSSIGELSSEDLVKLTAELQAWKASPAGQDAVKMGVAPKAMASITTLLTTSAPTDQLQRFLSSKRTVEQLQKAHPQTTFSLQTPFALLTPAEFAEFVNKSNAQAHRELLDRSTHRLRRPASVVQARGLGSPSQQQGQQQQGQQPLPSQVDWQQAGCVTHVKNQGSCGSCWVFAAVGALEGGLCANSPGRTLPVLSEQDVLSCGPTKGQCMAGGSFLVYDWLIRSNGGVACTEASVPYASASGSSPACTRYDDAAAKCDKVDLGIVSYVATSYEDHHTLEEAVAARPVAAQVRAGLSYFQFYSSGVIMGDEALCPGDWGDHELTIVGYGERNGTLVWKVKNSWGDWWGEKGYAYIERGYQGGKYGACGIESWGYYPIFRSQAPWVENLRCGVIRSGVELLGTTLKNVTVKDTYDNQCCDACRREPGCKAVTWGDPLAPNVCVLKATVDGERYVQSSAFASVTVYPKNDALASMCMPIEDNVDYPGNDLSRSFAASAEECCDKCTQDPNCGAYTWTKYMGGSCFLKYAKASYKLNSPQPDGSPYFRSGELYRCQPLQQDTDFPGEDLKNVPAKSARECCALCRANWPCQAFSWSNYQGGTCWLKRSAAPAVRNVGVVSATVYH